MSNVLRCRVVPGCNAEIDHNVGMSKSVTCAAGHQQPNPTPCGVCDGILGDDTTHHTKPTVADLGTCPTCKGETRVVCRHTSGTKTHRCFRGDCSPYFSYPI